jgi:hypothetical protein
MELAELLKSTWTTILAAGGVIAGIAGFVKLMFELDKAKTERNAAKERKRQEGGLIIMPTTEEVRIYSRRESPHPARARALSTICILLGGGLLLAQVLQESGDHVVSSQATTVPLQRDEANAFHEPEFESDVIESRQLISREVVGEHVVETWEITKTNRNGKKQTTVERVMTPLLDFEKPAAPSGPFGNGTEQ